MIIRSSRNENKQEMEKEEALAAGLAEMEGKV